LLEMCTFDEQLLLLCDDFGFADMSF
jgi:hypothetical protein